MTSKTHLALVAIAAIAVLSMQITPAFASNPTLFRATWGTAEGTTDTTSTTQANCGTVTNGCKMYLVTDNDGVEWVKVYYQVAGAVECDLQFIVEIDGVEEVNSTFYDQTTYGQWDYYPHQPNNGLTATDSVEAWVIHTNCAAP